MIVLSDDMNSQYQPIMISLVIEVNFDHSYHSYMYTY